MSTPRVRFAPSPTGSLHIGNVRTGLFNYLYARRMGGTFVLRIEDTDRERGSKDHERSITDGLAWLGLKPDEGPVEGGAHGPYRQSERGELYQRYLNQLLESGDAYPCYCTSEELASEREAQRARGEAPRYSGRCRDLAPEERAAFEAEGRTPVFRFRVPHTETVEWDDLIRGVVRFQSDDIGDFVLARADSSPLYNFTNVIDDATMAITHVARGEDLLPSTPNQLLLYRALDLTPPRYAHLPLIVGADRKKLSKREATTALDEYRREGYLPEALVNFLVLLGWSPPGEEQIFTLAELEGAFDFDRVHKASAVFDPEKLLHLNGAHIRRLPVSGLATRLRDFIPEEWYSDRAKLERALTTIQERLKLLTEAENLLHFYFQAPTPPKLTPEVQSLVGKLLETLEAASFERPALETTLQDFLVARHLGPKDLYPHLRVALTGEKASPSIAEVMAALGPDETEKRLRAALDQGR